MRNLGSHLTLIVLACAVAIAIPHSASTQASQTPQLKPVPAPYVAPTAGKEMYIKYCGSCHGAQGKGDGPAAPALKMAPTNLTLLMKNNKGKFPEARFREVLTHGMMAAHGSAEMPVWGEVFAAVDNDRARPMLRVENIMKYVETLNYPIK